MNKITKAELARRFNVNQSRINALLSGENPKIRETEDGYIDLDDEFNKKYIEERKTTVPKYTGSSEKTEEEISIDDEQLNLIEIGGELDFSKITTKKSAELSLALIKVSKAQKENQLLEIALQEKLKKIIETDILSQVITRSYGYLLENIKSKPLKIIENLRQIILSGNYTNNEDVKFLVKEYSSIYEDALKETEKVMLEIYATEVKDTAN